MEALSYCVVGLATALNTTISGNGTHTIVLAHGYGEDQSTWHYIIPTLAIYFKVLVYDLAFSPNVNPNLYDSVKYSNFSAYAQDLNCILDELKINNTIFVGHSMSAMIGCIAATKRPDLFKHLILLNGSPRCLNDTGYNGGFSQAQLDAIFNNMQTNFSGWVQNFVPQAIGVNNESAIAELQNSLLRMNPQTALSAAKTVFLSDNRHFLPDVGVSSTIIQSEEDVIVPNSVAYYMKKTLQYAEVRILKTKGHFPQLTVPDLLLRVLEEALGITEV